MNSKEIYFGTKEENNQRRREEALTRSPHERLMFFLQMSEEILKHSPERPHPNDEKDNFVIK